MAIRHLESLEKQVRSLDGATLEIRPKNSPHYPEIREMMKKARSHRKKLIAK